MKFGSALFLSLFLVFGASHGAFSQDKDIVDTAVEAGTFNTLLAAAQAAGLDAALRTPGPFTIFAPTDDAFAKIPQETLDALLADADALAQVLLYHAVSGNLLAADVVAADELTTLSGGTLDVSVTDDGVFINDSQVTATDILATNGVIHVIDTVLLPPDEEPEELDIVDTAAAAGSFTTLLAAASAAGLVDALKGEGPLTVFAPTDDAFAKIPEETINALLADPDALAEVLLYHVVAGEVTAADVVNLDSATTLQGQDVTITVDADGVLINDSRVIATDIEASNGIIHVIDTVLLPPSDEPEELDIVDTAAAAGNFNTLLAAAQAAGLVDALKGEGPLTVFAPTDEAFAKIPQETINALLADPDALAQVLLYHVVAGEVTAADVVNLDSATTLQGQDVTITVDEDGVLINDSRVIATDIEASNGIIHVIDTVLIPPSEEPEPTDIVDIAVSVDRFSTLVAAVQAAGLVDALKSDGPFTVFAPNNDAFAKLPEETLNALLADPAALTEILLYHVVPGALTAEDVLASNRLRMLQGDLADIEVNDSGAFIDGAGIIATDIIASNGVIHEIDTVILPETKGTTYEVTITNITKNQIFSPPVVVSHNSAVSLFDVGSPAPGGLKEMAEDGDQAGIIQRIADYDGFYDVATLDAPILPGESVTITVKGFREFRHISVIGMLVTTNDTFFSLETASPVGQYDWYKRSTDESAFQTVGYGVAYDAGTEYNSESCAHIPGPPCGNAGESPSEAGEGFVHISNGIAGENDLSRGDYDWRGPVAKVTIKRPVR